MFNVSGWKEHHSHPNNNKSQIIYKILTSVQLSLRAKVTEKSPTLKTKKRQHHRENAGREAYKVACAKVWGMMEFFGIMTMRKDLYLYMLVKSHNCMYITAQ